MLHSLGILQGSHIVDTDNGAYLAGFQWQARLGHCGMYWPWSGRGVCRVCCAHHAISPSAHTTLCASTRFLTARPSSLRNQAEYNSHLFSIVVNKNFMLVDNCVKGVRFTMLLFVTNSLNSYLNIFCMSLLFMILVWFLYILPMHGQICKLYHIWKICFGICRLFLQNLLESQRNLLKMAE